MKRFMKAGTYVLAMVMVSISLTGCNIDMAKIGDFISKIAGVISKVADGIKSFGNQLGNGTDAATASGTTAAVATDTVTIDGNASETAAVATGTASTTTDVGDTTADAEEENPGN